MESRNSVLDLSGEQFRTLGHGLVDRIADFLTSLPTRPVTPAETVEEVRTALESGRPLPDSGADPGELLQTATDLLLNHSLFNGSPRFYGYITSSAAPIGMLGDLLASAMNPNVGAWKLAPMATEIELQTIRWIAQFIGYPEDCGGVLVSGGNMANITCFLAARAAKAGWDIRKQGVAAGPRLCAYATQEAHTWLQKAMDLAGLGTDAIHWFESVQDLEALYKRDIEQGFSPFLVVGSAGTVSTGSVDPLAALAEFSRAHDLWFHVDGAYGAFAAALPEASPELKALSQADSLAVDPHKWLYAPLEAGCALVRDPAALQNAFSYHPTYYNFGGEAVNFYDLGPQNSRGFRALKVWLALQYAGASGYREMIREDIRLAKHLYDLAAAHPELEALSTCLSITTLRYVPQEPGLTEEYLNQLNQRILEAIEKSGEAFLSNAVIDGKFALRACIVNFRASESDVETIPELVVRFGHQLHTSRS